MRTRSPSEEPAVQVLDITQGGKTTVTGSESRSPPRWSVLAVVVALVAGLGYGFVLGRSDQPADEVEAAEVTTSSSAPISVTTVRDLDAHPVGFRRAVPGHDLGRGVTEYLNANMFSAVAVDGAGLVWLGGPTGVARLDPASGEFVRLTNSDGAGPLDVLDVALGPDGSLYASTIRGMSHWDGNEWAQDSVLDQSMSEWGQRVPEVGLVAVAHDGTVWLVTHEMSQGWEVDSHLHHGPSPFFGDVPTTTLDGWVHDIEIGPDGTVWALSEETVWHYDGDWTRFSAGWSMAMAVGSDGAVWLGRNDAIVRIQGGDTTRIPWSDVFGVAGWPAQARVHVETMIEGPGGSVWVLATAFDPSSDWSSEPDWDGPRRELVHVERHAGEFVPVIATVPPSLTDFWIQDMAAAPNRDLWIAADDRLWRFDGERWSDFSMGGQPPIGYIGSIAVGPAGEVWFAGDGRISQLDSGGWEVVDTSTLGIEHEYPEDIEFAWVESNHVRSWAGLGCTVYEWRSAGWRALPPLPEEPLGCWDILPRASGDGSLWLAVMLEEEEWAVYRWQGTTWEVHGTAPTNVSSIDVTPDGVPWLAGWGNIGWVDHDGWHAVFTGWDFEDVTIASDGSVWVLAAGWTGSSEVWHYREGTWEVDRSDLYPYSPIGLEDHPDGSVWVLEQRPDGGFVARGLEGGGLRLIVDTGGVDTMTIGPDGIIWAGGNGRLYKIDPEATRLEEIDLSPVDWRIQLDEAGPGVHTVYMNVEIDGLAPRRIADTSGSLIWNGMIVELCQIGVDRDDGFLGVGDIFQTTEGCGPNPTAMQDAFDEFGLPDDACVIIHLEGHDQPIAHCAPLSIE